MISSLLFFTVLPLLLILAAVWDLTSYTIPNLLPGLIALLFLLYAALTPLSWGETGIHILVGLGALIIGITMFSLGWIGGGDAKLFAACALWAGWHDILPFILWAALSGGALSLILIGFRQIPLPSTLARRHWIAELHHPKSGIPYGIALAAGFLVHMSQAGVLG